MHKVVQGTAKKIGDTTAEAKAKFLRKLPVEVTDKVERYCQSFTNRLDNTLVRLERSSNDAIMSIRQANLASTTEGKRAIEKLESIKKYIAEGGDEELRGEVTGILKEYGEKIATEMRKSGNSPFQYTLQEFLKEEVIPRLGAEGNVNLKDIEVIIKESSLLVGNASLAARFLHARSTHHQNIKKRMENLNENEVLQEQLKQLIMAKALLEFDRDIRLRMAFKVGDWAEETAVMAENYFVGYSNGQKYPGSIDLRATNKSISKSLADEISRLKKLIEESHDDMLRRRQKLTKERRKELNAMNLRVLTLYQVVKDSLSDEDKKPLEKNVERLNLSIQEFVNELGPNYTNTFVKVNVDQIKDLKKVFEKSNSPTDFALMLMNNVDRKTRGTFGWQTIYTHFEFMANQNVNISYFLLTLMEFKKQSVDPRMLLINETNKNADRESD